MPILAAKEREHIGQFGGLFETLRGARIFFSGGTGFFGCWMLEMLLAATDELTLELSVIVLTRSAGRFRQKAPHLSSHPAVSLIEGDVRTFAFPTGPFTHVIHAATEASVKLAAENPLEMFSTIVDGTRRVLDFTQKSGAGKLLFTSSGAVYGTQPPEISHVSEDYAGAPEATDPRSVYGAGKRAAEQLCVLYSRQFGFECKIARCFAFVGPYLPLDTHFAIGNFIRDAMAKQPILVNGDGTPFRSYLYASDLVVWLLTILARGISGRPYNVGSENEINIESLAQLVTAIVPGNGAIEVALAPRPERAAERYVPSTARARLELGLSESFTLSEAIERTVAWHRAQTGSGS